MDLGEVRLTKEKLEKGYTIVVESTVYHFEKSWRGTFYLEVGATGKVITVEENIGEYLDCNVGVEWIRDKAELRYSFYDKEYNLEKISLKEIIPPKDLNQLELIFE